ncbi:hypothetical protein ACIRSU_21880 [Streptomyces sp. NPDC101160]
MRNRRCHSILDIFKVIGPDEEPDYGTVKQVTEEEAYFRGFSGD